MLVPFWFHLGSSPSILVPAFEYSHNHSHSPASGRAVAVAAAAAAAVAMAVASWGILAPRDLARKNRFSDSLGHNISKVSGSHTNCSRSRPPFMPKKRESDWLGYSKCLSFART